MIAATLARIGESDCEEFHAGLLAQPVNTITSLAYCVTGVVVIMSARHWDRWRARAVVYGLCLVGIGVGSVLFHGLQPAGSRFVHDLPIVLLLAVIALHDLSLIFPRFHRVPLALFVVAAITAPMAAVLPDSAMVATGLFAAVAVGAEVVIYRRGLRNSSSTRQRNLVAAIVGVSVVAAATFVLGRSGAPSCDPGSEFQFHGLWHIVSAIAFGVWWWLALAERHTTGPSSPAPDGSAGTLAT